MRHDGGTNERSWMEQLLTLDWVTKDARTKRLLRSLAPTPVLAWMRGTRGKYNDVARVSWRRSGLEAGGRAFVEFEDGRRFVGYPTDEVGRQFYRRFFRRKDAPWLVEDAFQLAVEVTNRYWRPLHEPSGLARASYDGLPTNPTILEVGAFLGLHACFLAERFGHDSHVLAVEAIPENFGFLNENVQANGFDQITATNRAAWNRIEDLEFGREAQQRASAVAGVVQGKQTITVKASTIDQMVRDAGLTRVDLVRIQVNGAEYEALEGMTEVLRLRPRLVVTSKYRKGVGDTVPSMEALLTDLGYAVRKIQSTYIGFPEGR